MLLLSNGDNYPEFLREKGSILILGFFDGIHSGHRKVICDAVNYAKNSNKKTIMLTFNNSPAEYFGKKKEYIYPREYSYKLAEKLGVDFIIVSDFSSLAKVSAVEYIEKYLAKTYSPAAIFTGFNYTFGYERKGTPELLENFQSVFGYKYIMEVPYKLNGKIVSSTNIKEYLTQGEIESANQMLGEPFTIEGQVIYGEQIGRTIGFPTANIKYPQNIIRLPYGVYKVYADNKPAVLNWGTKPTVNGNHEGLEVHIPNFSGNLYGKQISIKVIKKLRDEKKFNGIKELTEQIKKDVSVCLEL